MNHRLSATMLMLALAAAPQLGQTQAAGAETARDHVPRPAVEGGATAPGASVAEIRENPRLDDELFIQKAAQANLAEIQAARIALEQSDNDQVKRFAQRMIDDHTLANTQVKQLSQALNIEMPQQMSLEQQTAMAKLDGRRGDGFDEVYAEQMVRDHAHLTGVFEQAANAAALAPESRRLAGQLLPTLRRHLEAAESLEEAID